MPTGKKPRVTKKSVLFALFEKGYLADSPEVRATKLEYDLRTRYYRLWKQLKDQANPEERGPVVHLAPATGESLMPPPEITSHEEPANDDVPPDDLSDSGVGESGEFEAETGAEEYNGDEEEDEIEQDGVAERTNGNGNEPETAIDKTTTVAAINTVPPNRGKEGKKGIPTNLRTQGLRTTVELSLKTLNIYYLVANTVEDELTLGDFLDHCAEDYLKGRGMDLGLINIAGGNNE